LRWKAPRVQRNAFFFAGERGRRPFRREILRKQALRRRASRKQARRERGVLVTSRVPGRHVKGAPGWVGPARVASPATRVTRIATTRCTSRCGLGSPRLSRPASAELARRRPGKRERNRAPDSWSLGWNVPQGASPPGHGEPRGQPRSEPASSRGRSGPGFGRFEVVLADRTTNADVGGQLLGSSQEQASRKRVSGIAGGRGRSPPMEGALVRAGGPSLTGRVAEADRVVLLVGITTEGVRNRLAPLPPAEHAGGEQKRERRPGRTCDHGSNRSGRSWIPGDRDHVRCAVEAGGSPSSEALPGATFTRCGGIQAIRRVLV
jgi:hypothetical protein